MPGIISVTMKSADLAHLRFQLRQMPQNIPRAIASAINKTLPGARKVLVSGLQEVTAIKTKQKIVDRVPVRRATPQNLRGIISVVGRAVGAINFPHFLSPTFGAIVNFEVGAASQSFPGAFRGRGLNDNRHLWRRIPGPKHRVERAHDPNNVGRFMEKIRPIYGLRVTTLLQRHPKIRVAAEAAASVILSKNIISQVDRFLSRAKTASVSPESPA